MGRIRSVKPELFKHGDLYDLEKETGLPIRLAWIGLFTAADREGRFKWRPRELQVDILPYDPPGLLSQVLDALENAGFIEQYNVDHELYGYIPKWHAHQVIRPDEAKSKIPPPPALDTDPSEPDTNPSGSEENPPRGVGVGKEGKGTGVGAEARSAPETPAPEVSPPEGQYACAPELRGNSAIEQALSHVPPAVQADWLAHYTPGSIKATLKKAVNTFLAESGALERVPNLGTRLTKWVSREKESLERIRPPPPAKDPPKPWSSGARSSLGGLRPAEALKRAQGAGNA